MVKIRLARQGAKKRPEYLIVAVDSNKKRDGEYLEKIGHYYPKAAKPADKIKLNKEVLQAWITRGAQPTQTVGQLIKLIAQ